MSYELHDRISLALARAVAHGLEDHADWIDLARENLRGWSARNAGSPRLLASYQEWAALLERPLPQVIAAMLDPGEVGQRLRQNSPFAGALSPREVWEIKRRCRDDARAA